MAKVHLLLWDVCALVEKKRSAGVPARDWIQTGKMPVLLWISGLALADTSLPSALLTSLHSP